MNRFSSAAVAALLALPLAAPVAHAQNSSDGGAMSGTDEMSAGTTSGSSPGAETGSPAAGDNAGNTSGAGESAASGTPSEDPNIITDMSTVVVSVGDTDITAGQIRDMLSSMPPQVQTQPMELLVPLAVEELVMRELVLQKARSEGFDESPQVQEMANGGDSENALENATIRAYLAERMRGAVTDETVQAAYDEAAANTGQEVPPLEEVRPQIEQQLRQRRLIEIRDELKNDIDVVYYGPDGEPRKEGASGMTMEGMGDGASSNGNSSGGGSGSQGGTTTGSGSGASGGSTSDDAGTNTGGDATTGNGDANSGN